MVLLIIPGIIGMLVCLALLLIKAFTKKPKKKTLIALVIFFVMCIVAVSSLDDSGVEETTATYATTNEATEAIKPATEPTTEPTTEPATTQTTSVELIAGEAGEYGELFTINKDTEFEETYYIYHIPAGTYAVTNAGEYMSQFSVYSDEIVVNDSGWEEVAEIFYVKVLDVGKSDTFTIEDGQFIEIHEPSKFVLELIG